MKTTSIKLLPLTIFLFWINIGFGVNHITKYTISKLALVNKPASTKPVAQNDTVAVCENSGVTIINVKATDADGDPLTASILYGPKNGTASATGGLAIN